MSMWLIIHWVQDGETSRDLITCLLWTVWVWVLIGKVIM